MSSPSAAVAGPRPWVSECRIDGSQVSLNSALSVTSVAGKYLNLGSVSDFLARYREALKVAAQASGSEPSPELRRELDQEKRNSDQWRREADKIAAELEVSRSDAKLYADNYARAEAELRKLRESGGILESEALHLAKSRASALEAERDQWKAEAEKHAADNRVLGAELDSGRNKVVLYEREVEKLNATILSINARVVELTASRDHWERDHEKVCQELEVSNACVEAFKVRAKQDKARIEELEARLALRPDPTDDSAARLKALEDQVARVYRAMPFLATVA